MTAEVKQCQGLWKQPLLSCGDKCNILECKSLQRILATLKQYEQWLYEEPAKDINCISNILKNLNESYSNKYIINDYKHIKQMNYKMISNNCTRSLTKCIPFTRHRRDNYKNYDILYFTKDIKSILLQKLFDQIHLYLYHPLSNNKTYSKYILDDNGHRFTTNKENAQSDQAEDESVKQIIDEPETEQFEEQKSHEMQHIDGINPEKDSYNFGKQFFYWNYYRNHKWFIKRKYENLKDELLNNDMCRIEQIVWNIEYQNGMDKTEEERVKTLRSNGEFMDKYGIDENIEISMNHLLSILFYCNTNDLQNIFSSTYRRLTNVKESDEEFKLRHGHYYHFAKLLQETVEAFGSIMVDDDLILYHGIDHPLYFTKMIAKFYSPTSTSKNRLVAAHFAGNNGMILELGKYERNGFYFECFLSGYEQEEECLLIGGYAALKIRNILHFISDEDRIESYAEYTSLIQCFFDVLQNKNADNLQILDLDINKTLSSLIKYKCTQNTNINIMDGIPAYIHSLFNLRCDNMINISIDLVTFRQIFRVCMNETNTMIEINLMVQIFTNLEQIKIILPNNFTFSHKIIRFLYQNLSLYTIRSSQSFQKVEFCFHSRIVPFTIRDQMATELQDDFDNIGWVITVQNNVDDDESIHFIKIIADTNPNYRPLTSALQAKSTQMYVISDKTHSNAVLEPLLNDNTIKPYEKQKELKLRIINEPLNIKRNYFATCCLCLCCTDLIEPLSFEERIIKLTIGFIRKYAPHDMGPDIYSLCIDYVGENFNAGKWKTNREILTGQFYDVIDFTVLFDPDEIAENWCCFPRCLCFGGLIWWCFGVALFMGKDIAGLVIVANNYCNNVINGDSKYVSFDVNHWIMIGCIGHLVYSIMYCGPCLCCLTDFEHRYDRNVGPMLLIPLMCCCGCFFIPWMVVGFLLYSEMIGYSAQVSDCQNVVLSWCVLQVIESVVAPIAYCCFQAYCTFHDD